MIDAGELKHKVTVKRNTSSSDGYGGFIYTTGTVGSFWAARTYLDGKFIFRDGKRILQTGIELIMRKNTVTNNIESGDILFLTNDNKEYRINQMFEQDAYTYKILADKKE